MTGPAPGGNPVGLTTGGRGSARAVADALGGCARERRAALIVVGSRGRSAVAEIMLGSVTMATLHHAGLPVRVVPLTEPGSAGRRRG